MNDFDHKDPDQRFQTGDGGNKAIIEMGKRIKKEKADRREERFIIFLSKYGFNILAAFTLWIILILVLWRLL